MKTQDLFQQNEELYKLQAENSVLRKKISELEAINSEAEFLKADKTFGVAVTGDVQLNKMEIIIVDTPIFQRLRKIRQLGSTYLVYPSAIHTRFEHSLGVLKQADLIIKKIRSNSHNFGEERNISAEEEQIIRLLALLHDIGHMPFGHTIEDEFGIFKSHDRHETRWEYFLGEHSEIGKIIKKHHPNNELYSRFYRLIKCENDFTNFEADAYIYDIVSNTVCADLLDYLIRDCLYTNLKINFHPRFLDYFFIKNIFNPKTKKTERRIAIRIYKKGKKDLRHDVITELIQLLRNRYYLGERVYYHHTKIMTSTLLAGAVLRAKEAGCFQKITLIKNLATMEHLDEDGSKKLLNNIQNNNDSQIDKKILNIHRFGDEELLLYLKNLPKKGKSEKNLSLIKSAEILANRYDNRQLYTQIKTWSKHDLGITDKDIENINNFIGEKDPTLKDFKKGKIEGSLSFKIYDKLISEGSSIQRLEIEDTICSYLNDMQSGDVLIYCPSFNMAMKLAKMKIAFINEINGEIKEDACELMNYETSEDSTTKSDCLSILKRHQELWALRIYVNPKFVNPHHPEYDEKYKNYKNYIIDYFEWKILGKNVEDESKRGYEFWNDFLRDRLHKIKHAPHTYSAETDKKISSLANTFAVETNLGRTITEIDQTLKNEFKIDE